MVNILQFSFSLSPNILILIFIQNHVCIFPCWGLLFLWSCDFCFKVV
jgi:hypothetical protein